MLLNNIPGISHALYADDVTIWTLTGFAGKQQVALRTAINTTEQSLRDHGLSCAPDKLELLLLKKHTKGCPPAPPPELAVNGNPILNVNTLHILGLTSETEQALQHS